MSDPGGYTCPHHRTLSKDKAPAGCCHAGLSPVWRGLVLFYSSFRLQKQTLQKPQTAALLHLWDCSYRLGLSELLPWKSPRPGG